jgi:23S rRNA (adenine2503-C2)-methyltransferase
VGAGDLIAASVAGQRYGLAVLWIVAVGALLKGMQAQVNLIPLNPTSGYAGLPSHNVAAKRFQEILGGYGLPSTVRQRRGIDIGAGCGQLAVAE